MTNTALIEELQKFPAGVKVVGWHNSQFSDKPFVHKQKVKVNNDGYIELWDEGDHRPEEAETCLMIDFE